MLFYLVLGFILFSCSGALSKRARARRSYFFAAVIFTVVAAFRFDIGYDYQNYYNILDDINIAGLARFEPLSLLLCMPSILCREPFLFFIISSLLIYPLTFYSFYKNSVIPILSCIVFIGLFYLISLSIVRQALAISVCVYSYRFLVSKSFPKFALTILIASLFHYSALISLLIYPIYYKVSLKKLFCVLLFIFFSRSILLGYMLSNGIYSEYISVLDDVQGGGLTRIFNAFLFICLYLIAYKKKFRLESKNFLSVLLVGLFCPYIFGTGMGERLGYYFIIYFCYAVPYFLFYLNGWRLKRYFVFLFITYFWATIFYTSNIPGQRSFYIPYQTIFGVSKVSF